MSRTVTILGLLTLAAARNRRRPGAPHPAPAAAAGSGVSAVSFRPASFAFAKGSRTAPPAMATPASPISLTASDGTGLALVGLEVNGVLEPPLAFTELHLTFDNPRDRTIEGQFRIALPPGAALSRFAMKNEAAGRKGRWWSASAPARSMRTISIAGRTPPCSSRRRATSSRPASSRSPPAAARS